MKIRAVLLPCSLLIALAAAVFAGEDMRFSRSFSSAEFAAAGLQKISPDQVAILDALVRRDADYAMRFTPKHPRAALFSQRLSADEGLSAGFNFLTAAEVARIDAQVAQLETPVTPSSVSAAAPAGGVTQSAAPAYKAPPEIHGSISYFYGMGSHGYSAQGGSIDLIYRDPEHNYVIAAGYSETRAKGQFLRCDGRTVQSRGAFIGFSK